ncbi:MAG TPA: hypothetical protein VJK03_04160 [Candidatus Nanoarchaeia archaeon]|nr:hypothetical protein [Candidatus Nanoarchaeia archaeon]
MKIIGYVLLILGVLSIILSFEQTKAFIPITLPEQATPTVLTIAGIILIVISLFLLIKGGKKGGGKSAHEVPVYEGNKIVAYRRV